MSRGHSRNRRQERPGHRKGVAGLSPAGPLLATAVQHHRSGHFDLAEALYRRVLQFQPGQVDALHLLGVLEHQLSRELLEGDAAENTAGHGGKSDYSPFRRRGASR